MMLADLDGRALEAYLGTLKVGIGLTFAFTDLAGLVPALYDFAWAYPRLVIAAPFLLIGSMQLIGAILNIKGYEESWKIRASAAALAIVMWVGILIKTSWIGEPSLTIPLAGASLPFSALLFWKAVNRLPIPGVLYQDRVD